MKNNPNYKYEIIPPKGLIKIDLGEIWRYKDLIQILIWRNIKVRYKQTAIGIAWAIFQPLLSMIIFSVLFGRLVKVPSEGVPYPIFVYAGLLFWNYFSIAFSSASNSLVEHEGIIKKVYFPRLIIPISTSITPATDFMIALLVFFTLMIYYHYMPSLVGVLLIPVFLLISFLTAMGAGVLLASINVKYRDIRYGLPFLMQIMLYLTPVIYPISLVPQKFQWLLYLNPMAGVITNARSSLLKGGVVDWRLMGISLAISLILLLIGVAYFRKVERFFADII